MGRAHAGAEHGVRPPQGVFSERLGPREGAVLDHPLVPAPHVVHEDVDPVRLPCDALERGRYLGIKPVVAANTCDVLIDWYAIVHRAAGHAHTSPLLSKCAGDPAANA